MPNEENLKMFGSGERTVSEERKMQSNGGKKSGETRRRKRSMKMAAKTLLDMPIQSESTKHQMEALGIDDEDMTNQMAMLVSMLKMALAGDIRASEFMRDTAGENLEHNREYDLRKKAAELKVNVSNDGVSASVNMSDNGVADDVVIYIPKMDSEEDCELPEDATEEDTDLPTD